MILSCNHISKAFGTDQILSDVSFHVEDQEKAAIVGINGAGKSTLLKIIVGELSAGYRRMPFSPRGKDARLSRSASGSRRAGKHNL